MLMIRIVAKHFVAGVEISRARVARAAPILRYMLGWPVHKVISYCHSQGWTTEELPDAKVDLRTLAGSGSEPSAD